MRIAIVMPLAEQRGGAELALLHLVQAAREEGLRWLVVFLEDGPMVSQLQRLGIDTHVIRAGRLRHIAHFLTTVWKLAILARHERIDVMVAWMPKAHLYAAPAAVLAGIPALWYQHGIPAARFWMDRLATILPAHGVLACSQTSAAVQAQLWPRRPVRVVHPGVELERFDPSSLSPQREIRRQLGLPPSGPLVGMVGRLQYWKGMHVLVGALPIIQPLYPDVCAVIVGGRHDAEPDYLAYLEQRVAELGLEGRVILAGLQRNIPEWMQAMDVVVNASQHEPFGMVVIEAMALGKPVVAVNAGGPTEIITDDVNGLLVPYSDARALADAVLRCLGDPTYAQRLGAAARERARAFSTQEYARNWMDTLRELVPALDTRAKRKPQAAVPGAQ